MIEKHKVTALLAMKGHSERIPQKNIKPLGIDTIYTVTLLK